MWKKLQQYWQGEQNQLILWIPVCFALGIGAYFALPQEPEWWPVLLLSEMLLAAIYFARRHRGLLLALYALLTATAGFADAQLQTLYLSRNLPPVTPQKLYLAGRIARIDKNYRGNPRIVLEDMQGFPSGEIKGRYRLSLVHNQTDLAVGQCVEMVAAVSPLFKTSIAGGFQFDRQLFFDGINGSGYVPSRVLLLECSTAGQHRFSDFVAGVRRRISNYISSILPPDEAAVAVAIVAGDRSKMDAGLINAYRDSGLAHFLSISGLHMSMIAGLMFFFVRLLMALIPPLSLRYNSKKAAAVGGIVISAIYLLISGAAIPSQRAFIMTLVVLTAVLCNRQAVSMRTLALAAMIVLLIAPQALVSAGFQMSFAAVTALVAFYEKYAGRINRFISLRDDEPLLKFGRVVLLYFIGVVVSDLVASLATMPYAIYHFNRVSLYTSLTNLVAGPIIGFVIMPFVLIALLLMPFGLAFLPLKLVGLGLFAVNALTRFVSALPNAAVGVVSMPTWGLVTITLGGLWLCLWRCRWRRYGWALIIIGMLSLITVKVPDVIIDAKGRTLLIKDSTGGLTAVKSGNKWNRKVWLSKYGITTEAEQNKNATNAIFPQRVDWQKGEGLRLDGRAFDLPKSGGASFYLEKDGHIRVNSVRDYIGNRPWNR